MTVFPRKQILMSLAPVVFALLAMSLLAAYGLVSCGSPAKASEPAKIECEFLNAWDFKRCENAEVICYTNEQGLSCKWK